MPRISELDSARWKPAESDLERLLTPCLIVHLDRVRGNIKRVLEHLQDDPGRWRPHVKTTKIPEVWRELFAAGVRQFKCATTREADVLGATLCSATRRYWSNDCLGGTRRSAPPTRTSKEIGTSLFVEAWRTCRRWSRPLTLHRATRTRAQLFTTAFPTSGRLPVEGARLYPRSRRLRGTSRRPIQFP